VEIPEPCAQLAVELRQDAAADPPHDGCPTGAVRRRCPHADDGVGPLPVERGDQRLDEARSVRSAAAEDYEDVEIALNC
jgi:hypothetical protein